jgi:hypothetical protein
MPGFLRPSRIEKLQAEHAAFVDFFTRSATVLNRRIDDYNLSVPSITVQVNRVDVKRVLASLDALLAPDDQIARNS